MGLNCGFPLPSFITLERDNLWDNPPRKSAERAHKDNKSVGHGPENTDLTNSLYDTADTDVLGSHRRLHTAVEF